MWFAKVFVNKHFLSGLIQEWCVAPSSVRDG